MEAHHKNAIEDFLAIYREQAQFVAILLAGSLAHGYAKADSDVDIVLVAEESEYRDRKANNKLAFSLWDICTYPGGYIDCKVVSMDSLALIAEKGSDAARYAFKDAKILHSRIEGLSRLLNEICRFPAKQQDERQFRFVSQLLAWKWYMSQAEQKRNSYLVFLAAQKIVLFSCRTILNLNGMLYPYHKWLLEETERAQRQPGDFQAILLDFMKAPGFDVAQLLVDKLFDFIGLVEKDVDWPNRFLIDSEMNWLNHEAPVDDL